MKNIIIAYFTVRNAYRYFRANWHPQRIWGAYIVLIAIPGAIVFDAHTPFLERKWDELKDKMFGVQIYIAEHTTKEAHAEEVPKIVQIEVDYSKMSEERIKEVILAELPPIFVEIAKCEGGFKPHATGPTNDHGPLQIQLDYHGARAKELGLDVVNNPYDNIKFAKMLYEENGLQPWSASKSCWSK